VVRQDLEQFPLAQALLDAAPPFGSEHLGMRIEKHLLQVRIEPEELMNVSGNTSLSPT